MKKFLFSLEAVFKYKKTIEKKQKAELARILAILNGLYAQKDALENAVLGCNASLERALQSRKNIVSEMELHHAYLSFLRDNLKELEKKILRAENEKKNIQSLLIVTIKELKSLERLRAEEYALYLEEVRKEEEKVLGDLMSYNATQEEPR